MIQILINKILYIKFSHDFHTDHGGTGDSSSNNTCNGRGLMSYGGYDISEWSDCSNKDFKTWYQDEGHECLIDFCPDNFTFFRHTSKCYKFVHQNVSWEKAKDSCKRTGGNLASVHDDKTNKFLQSLLTHRAFIGGFKKDNSWHWSDGSIFDYKYFHPNSTNDLEDGHIEIIYDWGDSHWNEVGNEYMNDHGYICQQQPTGKILHSFHAFIFSVFQYVLMVIFSINTHQNVINIILKPKGEINLKQNAREREEILHHLKMIKQKYFYKI